MKYWENGKLRDKDKSYNRSETLTVMAKKERAGFRLFDINNRALNSENCFDIVVNNGMRTIILIREDEIDLSRLLLEAAESLVIDTQQGGRKIKTLKVLSHRLLAEAENSVTQTQLDGRMIERHSRLLAAAEGSVAESQLK